MVVSLLLLCVLLDPSFRHRYDIRIINAQHYSFATFRQTINRQYNNGASGERRESTIFRYGFFEIERHDSNFVWVGERTQE